LGGFLREDSEMKGKKEGVGCDRKGREQGGGQDLAKSLKASNRNKGKENKKEGEKSGGNARSKKGEGTWE